MLRKSSMQVMVGVDIADFDSVASLIRQKRAREKYFSAAENDYCAKARLPLQHYAARFAAKEAFLKALGIGILAGIPLREIEVRRRATGKPYLKLGRRAQSRMTAAGVCRCDVSLSHGKSQAIAVVVLTA